MKEFLKDTNNLIASIIIICGIVIGSFIVGVTIGKAITETSNYTTGYKQALLDFKIIIP